MVVFTCFHFQLPGQVPGDDADGDQEVGELPAVLRVKGAGLFMGEPPFNGYVAGKGEIPGREISCFD